MNIAILGAFDRYNYGDLLYPMILKEYLGKISDSYKPGFYGLIEADMKEYGTIESKPFGEFYNTIKKCSSKNVIIICGGAVIGCRAGRLYSFLHPTPFLNICSNFCKLLHLPNISDIIAARKLKITWGNYPFSPIKPNASSFIVYSSVGDKYFKEPELNERLKNADYISVRNFNLYSKLKEHIPIQEKISLTADSASVISKIWPIDKLKKIVSPKTVNFVKKLRNGYLIFQAKNKGSRYLSIISNQLEKIYKEKGLQIVMVPLGRAVKHEDDLLLKKLKKKIKVPVEMPRITNIYDIMYVIARSNLFIGTSLHGNITAMSYGVNHLGITNVPKLDQYIKYWDVEPNKTKGCVKLSQIYNNAIDVLENSNKQQRVDNSKKLADIADGNLNNMMKCISRYFNYSP